MKKRIFGNLFTDRHITLYIVQYFEKFFKGFFTIFIIFFQKQKRAPRSAAFYYILLRSFSQGFSPADLIIDRAKAFTFYARQNRRAFVLCV